LALAIKELYKSSSEIRVIGSRHGEKLFETLVNREEMVKAEDLGDFFRIPADTRDLNYNKYFTEGTEAVSQVEEYTSHNTQRLDVEETKELLLSLRFIREDVIGEQSEMVFEP
jgi:UDP-glucose 4-epimerase